jgi:DNA-binding CsgD family transcriptional regulator
VRPMSGHRGVRALRLLAEVGAAGDDPARFACVGVAALARHVGADLTTLSVCNLRSGRRRVVSDIPGALSPADIAAFDRHFDGHPLVHFHATQAGGGAHRISDSLPDRAFRRTSLYADYYARIGIAHAIAVPLFVDGRTLVSFVLNRSGRDFTDAEATELDLLRGPLAVQYRQATLIAGLRKGVARQRRDAARDRNEPCRALGGALPLTPREREMVGWVAAGKSDRQIAAIAGVSVRTVQKHLEHVYVKLGVENRTAAAMRAVRATPR